MGRHVGQLQWELRAVRDREEDRERRTELSLEAIEALIVSKEEDADRRFRQQAEENADQINTVRLVSTKTLLYTPVEDVYNFWP